MKRFFSCLSVFSFLAYAKVFELARNYEKKDNNETKISD